MKEKTERKILLKRFSAVLLCLALLAAACGFAEEEEPLTWSEPDGRFIAGMLAPQREIRNEEEARAYAEELCPLTGIGPLPEGIWEILALIRDGFRKESVRKDPKWTRKHAGRQNAWLPNGWRKMHPVSWS